MENVVKTDFEKSRDEFILKQKAVVKDLRAKIVNDFQKLSYYEMQTLMDAVSYRNSLIGMAKCGKLTNFTV